MIVKRNLGDIAELTAGVISQRVLADKEDVETGDSVFVLVPKAIHDGELDGEWIDCISSCFSSDILSFTKPFNGISFGISSILLNFFTE